MKNRNTLLAATVIALAFAVAPGVEAAPKPDGAPSGNHLLRAAMRATRLELNPACRRTSFPCQH